MRANSSEIWGRMEPCWNELEPFEQQVLQLAYGEAFGAEDKGNDEIALLLGKTRNHIGVVKYRALRALRQCLQEHKFLDSDDLSSA